MAFDRRENSSMMSYTPRGEGCRVFRFLNARRKRRCFEFEFAKKSRRLRLAVKRVILSRKLGSRIARVDRTAMFAVSIFSVVEFVFQK